MTLAQSNDLRLQAPRPRHSPRRNHRKTLSNNRFGQPRVACPACFLLLLAAAVTIPGVTLTTAAPATPTHGAAADGDTQTLKPRVLHFPARRSLGQLTVQDSSAKRQVRTFDLVTDTVDGRENWQYLCEARGDVAIAPGRRVRLTVTPSAWRDLSPLAKLRPDDLYLLDFEGPPPEVKKAGDNCMPHIGRLTGLKVLKLWNTNVTGSGLRHLGKLTSLERLYLPQRDPRLQPPRITDADMARLAGLSSLKGLYIGASRITNTGVSRLVKLRSLEELTLGGGRLTNAALVHLAKLPHLRVLSLWGENFTDRGLVHLRKAHSLRILNLEYLPITDAGLAHLSDLTELESLNLYKTLVTDKGLVHLKEMPSLRKLNLGKRGRNIIDGIAQISDRGIAHLAEIAALEHLRLPNHGITDKGLAHLDRLNRLKYLWVNCSTSSPLTDAGLKHVSRLDSLEELHIGGKAFSDKGMSHVAKLSKLKTLHLSYAGQITATGLADVTRLKSLKRLDLGRTEVTIFGLSVLNGPPLTNLGVNSFIQDDSGLDISGLMQLEELTLRGRARRVGGKVVYDEIRDEDLAGRDAWGGKWFMTKSGTRTSSASRS